MSLHDTMHLVAISLTVLAVGVHPGWRKRASSLGLVAAILMLSAMVDVAFVHRVSVVLWIPLLLAAAIGVAATRSPRRLPVAMSGRDDVWVTTHDSLGLVATAALLPLMHVGAVPVSDHGGHGASVGVLLAVILLIASGHVAGSFLACVRNSARAGRVPFAAMGMATSCMALSVVTA